MFKSSKKEEGSKSKRWLRIELLPDDAGFFQVVISVDK